MFQLETITRAAVLLDLLGGTGTIFTSKQDYAAGRVPTGVSSPDNDNSRVIAMSNGASLNECL